jgi:hypothetical protein
MVSHRFYQVRCRRHVGLVCEANKWIVHEHMSGIACPQEPGNIQCPASDNFRYTCRPTDANNNAQQQQPYMSRPRNKMATLDAQTKALPLISLVAVQKSPIRLGRWSRLGNCSSTGNCMRRESRSTLEDHRIDKLDQAERCSLVPTSTLCHGPSYTCQSRGDNRSRTCLGRAVVRRKGRPPV